VDENGITGLHAMVLPSPGLVILRSGRMRRVDRCGLLHDRLLGRRLVLDMRILLGQERGSTEVTKCSTRLSGCATAGAPGGSELVATLEAEFCFARILGAAIRTKNILTHNGLAKDISKALRANDVICVTSLSG
jgi:hypothetical protein